MRHALITADTAGMRRHVTEAFIEADQQLTIAYRSDVDKGMTVKQELARFSDALHIVQADVTQQADLDRLVDEAVKQFGGIDYLINNAGPFVFERKKMLDYTEDEW